MVYPIGPQYLRFGQHVPRPSVHVIPVVSDARFTKLQGEPDHIGSAGKLARVQLVLDKLFRRAFIQLAGDAWLPPSRTAYVVGEETNQILYPGLRPLVALDHEFEQIFIIRQQRIVCE